MASLPTREDYFQIGAQEVIARSEARQGSARISPEAVFTEGTNVNIMTANASAMADEATRHLAIRMADLWLDSSEGAALDRLIRDRWSRDLVRKQATSSVVPLVLSRAAPPSLLSAVVFEIGSKARTPQGTEFKFLEPASFTAGSTGPVSVQAQAVNAGIGGNVDEGTITELLTFGQPADAAIQVTNLEPAAGGDDIESDARFRERARDFFRTARRGILAAIEFGALTVRGVRSATVVEVLGTDGLPNGMVQLFIADAVGRSNSALAAAVITALREFRAGGIPVDVFTSTRPQFEPINYVLGFRSGVDTVAARNQLKALTVARVNLLAPREPLQRSLLFAIARQVPGAIVDEQAVALPAGDIFPSTGQVLKTALELVKVNGQ